MKKLIAAAIAATLTVLAVSPCVAAAELSAEQQRHYELVQPALEQYDKFGFESANDMFCALLNRSCDYDSDHIYDLTGDNEITMGDAMFILSFLGGNAAYSYNYSEMDGNADDMIDQQDAFAYLQYWDDIVLNYITDNCITTHTAGTYTPQTLKYRRYSASTGVYLGRYTLVPLNTLNGVSNTETTVYSCDIENAEERHFGAQSNLDIDNFDHDTYRSGVIKVNTSIGQCSGFAVKDHVIATCAHVFADVVANVSEEAESTSQIGRADINSITFYSNATTANTSYTGLPVEYHIPERYFHGTNCGNCGGFDYALITMGQTFNTISNLKYFELGIALDDFISSNTAITMTGAFSNGQASISGEMYNLYAADKLYYTAIGAAGHCGSPIYITFTNGSLEHHTSLALETTGNGSYDSGTRITSDIIHFYLNNSNINY